MRKFIALLLIFVIIITNVDAQTKIKTSPFHPLPKPQNQYTMLYSVVNNNEIQAYRFVLPFASYSVTTKQMSTGIGYGWNKMHWDSTRYYTDLSIFAAVFVNGNVAVPTPYNFTSVGFGVGLLNGLVNICPTYDLPSADKKGAFDLKLSFGLTLK